MNYDDYTWKIEALHVDTVAGQSDVVVKVDYLVGVPQCQLPMSINIPFGDPATFTDYSQLTEAQVISWVKAHALEEDVQSAIDMIMKNAGLTLRVKAVPWPLPEPAQFDNSQLIWN